MTTFAEKLKSSTRNAHEAAESNEFQRRLFGGVVPIESYAAYLQQLYLIHHQLETHLSRLRADNPQAGKAVQDWQFQEKFLQADLSHLGKALDSPALPATSNFLRYLDSVAAKSPVAVLGAQYVLLGSKHGGKFIAQVLKKQHSFVDGAGHVYFDPYGGEFRSQWLEFISALNELNLTESEQQTMLETAEHTFAAVGAVGNEILQHHSIVQGTSQV